MAIQKAIYTPPDAEDFTWLLWDGDGGKTIIKDMKQIKADARAPKCQIDGLIVLSYSWGGPSLMRDLQKAVKDQDMKAGLVFTIDPVPRNWLGLPLGNLPDVDPRVV